MPDPYRRNIKYRTGTFLHWYGIFMLYPILHVGRDRHGTVVADVQHMAAALTEAAVNGCLVGVQQLHGDKCLNGACKAAALQTPCTTAVQHLLASASGTPCSCGALML